MMMPLNAEPESPGVVSSWIALGRRRWLVGVAVFSMVFGITVLQLWRTRPIYRADAKLRIGEPPPNTGVGAGSILGFMRLGGDPFANDLELLNSRTVTEAVVRDAALTVKLMAPRGWHRDSLFQSVRTTEQTSKASYTARWLRADQVEVRAVSPRKRLVGNFPVLRPATFGGVTIVFQPQRRNGPDQVVIKTVPFGEAVRRTTSRIKVSRRKRDANVAELVSTDTDPALARLVIASAVSHFTELRSAIAKRESGQNVDSLRNVARHTLAELTAAESELEQMQRRALLVDADAQTEAFVERYSAASTLLETTRAERQTITATLARSATVESPAERWTRLLAYRPFLTNLTIGALLSQLNALEAKRVELAPRRSLENREYSLVLDQIAYIDRSLAALARDIQTSLQEQERRLEAQVEAMERSLAGVPRNVIELARRQRSARVLSEVLVLTEQRLRQEELRQALSFSNIQVIDPPALQYKPVWPRKQLGVLVGALLALMSALLAVAVSEQADRRVRRAQVTAQLTGAPVLGVVVRSPAGLRVSALELRALVQHASVNGSGPLRIVLVPIGRTATGNLAETIRDTLPSPVAPGAYGPRPEISETANVRDFASASAAAQSDVPVALVIDADATTRAEIAQAAALIRQAGGRIGGTILICGSERAAHALWA